ncbi:U3 small nucleolar ribonucleoprotein protein IMP3-like [Ornithodoros turicata]|uniref:U3 small nucleolar ribonucleoprotein protein IMP3-like n=1 Tax=Ornithodoros turicata TaxID=34597 RepID=UPI003138E528
MLRRRLCRLHESVFDVPACNTSTAHVFSNRFNEQLWTFVRDTAFVAFSALHGSIQRRLKPRVSTMVRKLKYHEQKLLKKVDFISWEVDNNLHEVKMMKKYFIQKREDYTKYNKLSRSIRELARKIKELDAKDPFREKSTRELLEKLHSMGLITTKENLELCDRVTASSFCRRRLPVIMVRNQMAQQLKMATQFVEQGHVRIGPDLVTDPAFLVSRQLEDFVTWVDSSAIRKHVAEYNDMRDDYDLL